VVQEQGSLFSVVNWYKNRVLCSQLLSGNNFSRKIRTFHFGGLDISGQKLGLDQGFKRKKVEVLGRKEIEDCWGLS